MEESRLIFFPWPTMGHIAQLVELAKLMITQEGKLSITILVMNLPDFIDSTGSAVINSLVDSNITRGLRFFHLPPPANPSPEWSSRTRGYFVNKLVESQKRHVQNFIEDCRIHQSPNSKLVGCVVDMLCTTMIDVVDKFDLPSYVFFTSSAGFLGLMLHLQILEDECGKDISEFSNSVTPLPFPSFSHSIPPNVLPLVLVDRRQWLDRFIHYARAYRKAKAIIVNTFPELELHALKSFNAPRCPKLFSVGPILNQVQHGSSYYNDSNILKWLDNQPPKSVVYVCFGSQGSLNEDQVKELAKGLELSGYRFVWSLRRPSPKNNTAGFPSEYDNYEDVLPEGFLDRTAGIGRIVGWVAQLALLSHEAVGGFVSHCGWNSILESIWCGVPIATWPLHSEQQLNAFQMVRELGLAVAISVDYQERKEDQQLIKAEEIERGIRELMDSDCEVRMKVKEMGDKSKMSMSERGSSYNSLISLIHHILHKT